MTKPKKWPVRPAKTRISLGIHPVWSESLLSAWRKLGLLVAHWVHSEDSDQTGRIPRLIWVIAGRICHFVGFVMQCLKCWKFRKIGMFLLWQKDFTAFEQWRFRRAFTSAYSRQSLHCSHIHFVNLRETSDKVLHLWFYWETVHVYLKICFTKLPKGPLCMTCLIWAMSRENLSLDISNQLLFSYREKLESWNCVFSKYRYYTILAANNKVADQTMQMCRLICAFVVRIWHKTDFLMIWLNISGCSTRRQ